MILLKQSLFNRRGEKRSELGIIRQ